MSLFNKIQNLLAVDGKDTGGAVAPEMDKEEVIEFLAGDDEDPETIDLDEKKTPTKEDDDKEERTEEDDELKEIEDDLEEPDEEKLELTTPVSRREILKTYPDLFKKFPYLEKAYYREREYTEIFPTIPEAREAVEKAQTLDKFEKDLIDGNLDVALKVIKNDSKKFNNVVDDYLNILGRVDEKAQHHVIGNILKTTILSMVNEGRESNNEALQTAAQIINQYVFGSSKFTAPVRLASDKPDEKDEEKTKLEDERKEFLRGKFEDARDSLNSRVTNTIKATIDQNIDPRDSMGSYVKKAASSEAYNALTNLIDKDTRFKAILDRLWDNAFKSNFSRDSLDKIKQAYTSKARTLLPSVIKTARTEAMKGIGKRVKDDSPDEDKDESKTERRSAPETRERKSIKNITNPKDIPKGMTSKEFLMMD